MAAPRISVFPGYPCTGCSECPVFYGTDLSQQCGYCGHYHVAPLMAASATFSPPPYTSPSFAPPPAAKCVIPTCSNPQQFTGTGFSPYCSPACEALAHELLKQRQAPAQVNQPHFVAGPAASAYAPQPIVPAPTPRPTGPTCKYPGCTRTCAQIANSSEYYSYCSRAHAVAAEALDDTPQLIELVPTDTDYVLVKDQFEKKWGLSSKPTVEKIYRVKMPGRNLKAYEAYKQSVIANRPNLKIHGKGGPGNEQRRFHGTTLQCDKYKSAALCSNSGCAVCGIVKNGFLLSKASGGNFGKGIYSTSTSSKSHSYNSNNEQILGKGRRAMFLCKVVVGKTYKLKTTNSSLTKAPPGYDSVLGDYQTNDEMIVYDDAAMVPRNLIIYKV